MNLEEKRQLRKNLVSNLLGCVDPITNELKPQARGKIAELKMFLRTTETARNRAIPTFARLADAGLIGDVPAETVATLFALYPHQAPDQTGNFGETCHDIATKSNPDAFDRHFQRLLSARSDRDAATIILKIGQVARSKRSPINYYKLVNDLAAWSQPIRLAWARSYFKVITQDAHDH
jgi:CRISPR type I-E-associated protein CasB/Cse2